MNEVKTKHMWFVTIFLVLIIFVMSVFMYVLYNKDVEVKEIHNAIFLTNGQVYFGIIQPKKMFDEYITINDIYYLQMKQDLQSQDDDDLQGQSDLTLTKLGNELHGPTDEMKINMDHVLFIEELADDSRVLGAIKEYKKNK